MFRVKSSAFKKRSMVRVTVRVRVRVKVRVWALGRVDRYGLHNSYPYPHP